MQPGISRNKIVQVREDALKIRISVPPVERKTNRKEMRTTPIIIVRLTSVELALLSSQKIPCKIIL